MTSYASHGKVRRSPRLTRQRVILFTVSSWVTKFALLVLALLWWLRPSVGELGGVAYPPSQCGACTFQGGCGMLQAGSLWGPCLQCAGVRIHCEKVCFACAHACYHVVLVCLYWGGLGYGQCMLRTLLGCHLHAYCIRCCLFPVYEFVAAVCSRLLPCCRHIFIHLPSRPTV